MIEKIYDYSTLDDNKIEQLVQEDPVQINHIILPKDSGLPEHYSNSDVYMIVLRGNLSLQLNNQEPHIYSYGQVINVPFHTKMNVKNYDEEILEFFVVKAPHPRNY